MLICENILLALAGLKANKSRAILTMLGIIIGIASVIAIMTVGSSINKSITSSMESMGVNNITVGLQQKSSTTEVSSSGMMFTSGPRSSSLSDDDYFTDEMINDLLEKFSGQISGISLSESIGSGVAEDVKLSANVSVTGVNSTYIENEELEILAGRAFIEQDYESARKVALVSDRFVENMFDGNNMAAIGKAVDILINNRYYTYTVIGVYEYVSSGMEVSTTSDSEVTTTLYLPLETAQEQTRMSGKYQQFTVLTTSETSSSEFLDIIENYMNLMYYRNNESYQVSATSMETMVSTMTDMLNTISIAISIIAGISLLVGGIGVMNIMLVSITERTKEIGTRKALGATNGSIRIQFIMESIVICMIGGIIGICLGIGLT